jgi:major membrane immunogen (membrane-anchored lipoprotein)
VRLTTLIVCALLLGACSQSDSDRTRAEAHQTAEQVKHDSRVALDKAEVEAKKANKELSEDLNKARQKVRGALDEHEDRSKTSR